MSSPRPKPQIIVMTTYEDKADVRRALKAGAKAHLVKGTDAMNCLFCSTAKIMKPEELTAADLCLLSYLLFMF